MSGVKHTVLKPDNPIGQVNIFAQPRSGGTLMCIFMRRLVSFKCSLIHPKMVHSENIDDYGPDNFLLIRHPIGVFGSMVAVDSIDRYNNQIVVDERNVKTKLREFVEGQEIFDKLVKDNPNIPVVRYEDYHNNYDYLYRLANETFDIRIDMEEFKQFQKDFEVEKVKEDIAHDNIKEDDYRPYHISSGKGDNYANIELIPTDLREDVISYLLPTIRKYNYEEVNLDEYPYRKIRSFF